ncbi:MAG TPA: hypothetical protein VNO23_04165 [Candidatus Binatia bacterium]|nr:hypothetical protein [Candidatus Binatia bacterium]
MRRRRLILAGIVGRYPVGGVTWCALHYLIGFQRLGYEVFYLEDTGECGFDPIVNGISKDPSYAVRYLGRHLARVGLEQAWTYVDYRGRYHGQPRARVVEVCREADALVNLSGGCWIARPEYDRPVKIFIDTDPGFTQQAIATTTAPWYRDFFAAQRALFTFALNIGTPRCSIAATPFHWQPTIQPLVLDEWPVVRPPAGAPWTTVLSWRIDNMGLSRGKAGDILRMLDLPRRSPQPVLVAVAGNAPVELLQARGWRTTDAVTATRDADRYREFIQRSRGELGFAKAMYVETRSGWFSDRTQCYLASGRPAVVRDTGFGDVLPTGEGLLAFTSAAEAEQAMAAVEGDYDRHRRRAREIAAEYFDAEKVLRSLLERAGVV